MVQRSGEQQSGAFVGARAPRFRRVLASLHGRWRAAARVRIVVWACLASVICGVTGFLEPVDDLIRNHRYQARAVEADRSIVIVGIDQHSLEEVGERWPWLRPRHSQLIDRLKQAGARRIFFDMALSDADTRANDQHFIAVSRKYQRQIYLGAGFGKSENGVVTDILLPAPPIRTHVEIASFKVRFNPLGQVDELYFNVINGGTIYPSISAVIAGHRSTSTQRFRPDFSIRAESFPYLSASDVLLDNPDLKSVRGADVIVGVAARSLGDTRFLPSQGALPGVYLHAIGAQTLKSGMPTDAGWPLPLLIALTGCVVSLCSTTKAFHATGGTALLAALALGPIYLDSLHVSVEVAPALLALVITSILRARLRLGWRNSRMNETSGLANVLALRELHSQAGKALVAAKIANYGAIIASFERSVEDQLISEIVSRLRLIDKSLRIYQADDGVFYWVASLTSPKEIGDHLEGLKSLFAATLPIEDRRVDLNISFGVDLDDTRAIASRAGSALMCAEEALRTGQRWKLYDPARTTDAAWQLSLPSEIDRAIKLQHFWLAYQPKLDLRTGRIVGCEVLLRWRHPERGEINPADFIVAAEQSQRILRLTDYVIERTVASARLLKETGCKLAINASISVLSDPAFAGRLACKCRDMDVASSQIIVEVTESMLMSADNSQIERTFIDLRDAGFSLSIDDFGTGFSSLEYVRRVPAQEMKIDQSFVRRVTASSADRIVVESVLRMAHELGRRVVAEGVEDEATLTLLRELGCDEAQGYYVGRPVPFAAFRSQLRRQDRHAA